MAVAGGDAALVSADEPDKRPDSRDGGQQRPVDREAAIVPLVGGGLPVDDKAREDAARVVVENAVDGSRLRAASDGGPDGPGEVLPDRWTLFTGHGGAHEE